MNSIYVPARLALLTMLALIMFLAGCASKEVPQPVAPPWYSQQTVQAADHWREIAVEVAEKVRDALVQRDDIVMKPIYVADPDSRPFMLSFHQLLKTELVSRAVQVSEKKEGDSVFLEYDVLTVKHAASRPGHTPQHEIVVNTRLSHNNRYVTHLSCIRYINDDEWPMYFSVESVDPSAGKRRTIKVKNR